jgi:large subunit ribosomal protein L9
MEIILRQHVEHLGERGEIVEVAPGYARNYLLPRKLALPATVGNKKHVERERRIVEASEAQAKAQAEAQAARMSAVDLTIARRVGDTNQLYGSVTAADIVELLKEKGFDVDRRKLILPEQIKTIGDHAVPLKLHRAVTVPLLVHVVRVGGAREAPPVDETPSVNESSPTDEPASE